MRHARLQPAWPGWCCPYCAAPLERGGDGLHCPGEGRAFATHGGVHRLLPEDRLLEARALAARRRPTRDEELIQAASGLDRALAALREALGPGPWRTLEAGAGDCRLSLRLDELGHHTVAVDVELDAPRGLGAAVRPLERAEAEPEALPLEPAAFDLAVATGVLQHAARPVRALVELRRVTRRGGALLVVGTPRAAASAAPLFESAGWTLVGMPGEEEGAWPARVGRRDG